MSAHFRAAAVVREVRALLRTVRTFTTRLSDDRRTQERRQNQTAAGPRPLFLESALAAAKSMQAPIVSG